MRTRLRGKITLLFMMLGLLLAVPALALATDEIIADGDEITTGNQNSRNLGDVAPGATLTPKVDFWLSCAGGGDPGSPNLHFDANDSATLNYDSANSLAPTGGTLNATNVGAFTGPSSGWPTDGQNCNQGGNPNPIKVGTSTVTITAPSSPDTYTYTVRYTLTLGANTTSGELNPTMINVPVTFTLRVVQQNQAPVVQKAAADAIGNEGSQLTTSGSFSDPDGDALTITKQSGAGVVTQGANGAWSWSHTPDDNGNGTVVVEASDGTDTVTDSFDWSAANVAPTIQSISASAQNALAGKDVTFTGAATDPSIADTNAGFFWQWAVGQGAFGSFGNANANTFTTSFANCGSNYVRAIAKDKNNDESAPFSSASVNVYNASYNPPLNEGMQNTVQAGRVIPVKISVGCASNLTGLTPSIQLLKGLQNGGEDVSGSDNVETLSSSAADTNGVMRAADGGYIYNLQVPSNAKANDLYTVRVNPFGGNNASSNMYVVLKIRK